MKLKQVCSLSADYGLNISAESYVDGGVPMIRTSDFDDMGRLALSEAKAVSISDARDKLLEKGDILFSRSGTVGRCMVFEETKPCTFAAYLVRFRPRLTQAHPKFIFYLAQSKWFRHQVSVETIESTIGNFNGAKFASLEFPQLFVGEQKAIADFLDRETARIDQLVEKKERQVDVLREREEATFRGVVTGLKRTKKKKISGVEWIGDIPEHWDAPKFTHIARLETGHTPSRKEDAYWVPEECLIPWFSLADVWQVRLEGRVYVSETAEKISQLGMENSAARLLPANTVILSRTASVGFPAILVVPMATTQDYVGWICGARVRPKYLYYVLRAMKSEFRRLMMGSTHQTIYLPDVRSFHTPLPPLEEQDQIIKELDAITGGFQAAAAKITSSVEKLCEYRAALITAAVTGQIDVATWGKRCTPDRRLDAIEADTATAAQPEQQEAARA